MRYAIQRCCCCIKKLNCYNIEIILNIPLAEFEESKHHSLSVLAPSGEIVVFDKTSGETMNIMPKSLAHVTLRCQDE